MHPIFDHQNLIIDCKSLISRMADNCITCKRPVTSRQQGIQCDVCLQWNHRTCNNGKLPFILHFHSVCKNPLWSLRWCQIFCYEKSFPSGLLFFFLGISQQDYRAPVRTATGMDWVCTACQFFSPVAESSIISMTESSAETLESSESNPRSTHSDSFRSSRRFMTPPPDQTTSETMVSLKLLVESCHFKM